MGERIFFIVAIGAGIVLPLSLVLLLLWF